jgi:arylsulfatase A-like enzyme
MKTSLALALLLSSFCIRHSSFAAQSGAEAHPNILFIYTDDQSQRTAGCYRDEGAWQWVQTPNIDRLAAEGVRFTTAYGAAWCTPSRVSVLTGLQPHGVPGVRLKGVTFPGEGYDPALAKFWPENLRNSGYETAMIGKWHIGNNAGHGRVWDHSVIWDQNTPKGDWYNNQKLAIDGAEPKVVPGYSTDVYTRFATDYVRGKHDKPWLLWLCYNAPHTPITSHPRHNELYKDADVPVPADVFGPRMDKQGYMRNWTMFNMAPDGMARYKGKTIPMTVRGYNRLVSSVDEGVGELLRALEETGQIDNTLIIFTSDQGYAWGEHGFAWKVGPYDACLRMPLIFRLPGQVERGGVCRQPVGIVDLAPTVLGFAGLPLPWEMHGHDLRPLLRKPDATADRPLLTEHFGIRFGTETDRGETGADDLRGVPWWLSLRQGRYKYVRYLVPHKIEELYDLATDPAELKNIALDPAHRTILEDYRERLHAELKRTKAGLLDTLK